MRARTALVLVGVLALLLCAGIYFLVNRFDDQLPGLFTRACEVRTDSGAVDLDAEQMANAATIAAVGLRRKLPDRAIVIALATALQESKLQNLPNGDRDSVGLFQQRPSQGWGTVAQLQDPRYAATKFYARLERVRGWQQMRVTDAAQKVQRSAHPMAYEKWSTDSIVLTEALAGHAPRAVTCSRSSRPTQRGEVATQSLATNLRLDWGKVVTHSAGSDVASLVLAAGTTQTGWRYAHWLVAHSNEHGVERVHFDGQEWSADRGSWEPTSASSPNQVVAEVYRT